MNKDEKKDEHFPLTGIMITIGLAGLVIFLIDVYFDEMDEEKKLKQKKDARISEAFEGVVHEFDHVNQVINAVANENVTLKIELEKLRKKLKPEGETTS